VGRWRRSPAAGWFFSLEGVAVLKEALAFLQENFISSQKLQVILGPDGSSQIYKPNGEVVASWDGYPTREVECLSLRDFVATLSAAFDSIGPDDGEPPARSIAVGAKSVKAYARSLQDQYSIEFPLAMTKPAERLSEFLSEKSCDHKLFVKILRTSFRGVCDDMLVKQYAKVSFVQNAQTDSTAERGRHSFGKSVDAAIANAEELPESFVVRCNLFTGVASEIEIEVFVFVDFDNAKFSLWIDSQQWANELEKVRREICKTLGEEFPTTPILIGEVTGEAIEKAARFN
jgi:hypothetical protein